MTAEAQEVLKNLDEKVEAIKEEWANGMYNSLGSPEMTAMKNAYAVGRIHGLRELAAMDDLD